MNWDMIGHQWAVGLLRSHILNDQVRHAYLLTGSSGLGKRTLAVRFAQVLSCMNPPESAEFCGDCRACRLIQEGTFPDLHIVSTKEHGRTLKVDQIRELQRKLSLSPFEGKFHIALLPQFHQATEQAANALLKTLEEPPRRVIMLLTAESVESLLPTIVSRCEVVPLRPLSVSELESALAPIEEVGENANLFAGLSAGRPGYALRLAQDEALVALRDSRIEDLVNVIGFNRIDRFSFIEKWDKSLRRKFDKLDDRRLECIAVIELWLSFWRDVMLSTYKVREPESNPDKGSEIDALSEGISKAEIVEAIQALERSEEAIRRNANLRLALETLMIELPYLNMELTSA